MFRVCHVTSVHKPEDIRIFKKECISLVKNGYETYLVQQGDSYEKNGVKIVGVGSPSKSSRLHRIFWFSRKVFKKALLIDADLYHLHDPELLLYGLILKRKGKKVIFDSHESTRDSILTKYWIPSWARVLLSNVYNKFEGFCIKRFDATIGVNQQICSNLNLYNSNVRMITNFPILEDVRRFKSNKKYVIFPGLIGAGWNIDVLIDAVSRIDSVNIELRSRNVEQPYGNLLKLVNGWEKVNFPGSESHEKILDLISGSLCGVALCAPRPNTGGKEGTLGNTKIFEYMMMETPVVCSNFRVWKEIIEKYKCGICVNPNDSKDVEAAIRFLLNNPDECKNMGKNGRIAIEKEFNWNVEEKKLIALYEGILI